MPFNKIEKSGGKASALTLKWNNPLDKSNNSALILWSMATHSEVHLEDD